jgi:hypothetical protein
MGLNPSDIVPEGLHKKVGWDLRHHFMAETIVDRFGLVLPPGSRANPAVSHHLREWLA